MRIRHALTILALGGALAVGGAAVPAQATELTQSAKVSANVTDAHAPSWHYHGTYDTNALCDAAGKAQDLPYKCQNPFTAPWAWLWLWY